MRVYVDIHAGTFARIILRSNLLGKPSGINGTSERGWPEGRPLAQESTSPTTSCCVAIQATMCIVRVRGWLNDDNVSWCANVLPVRKDYAEDMLE